MSITTYAELQTAIGNWLQRDDLSSAIPDFITLFEACANRRLRVRQQETTVTLAPSLGTVALPGDYLAWRRVTWAGTNRRELEYVSPSWLQAFFSGASSGTPSAFTIEGANLLIRPIDPTIVELEYFRKISAASSGANWLLTEHPDLYLFGSLTEAQSYSVNADSAAFWKARRDEIFDEIERLNNKSRGAGSIRVLAPAP
jgi:hypothetical protein